MTDKPLDIVIPKDKAVFWLDKDRALSSTNLHRPTVRIEMQSSSASRATIMGYPDSVMNAYC